MKVCTTCQLFHEPECPKPELTPKDTLTAEIREQIRREGEIGFVEGAFGDGNNMGAYIEKIIENPDGVFTKYLGISNLYNGRVDKEIIDSVAQMKRIFMSTLRLVAKFPFRFSSKRMFRAIVDWIAEIYAADLMGKLPLYQKWNVHSRELIRALCATFDLDTDWPEYKDAESPYWARSVDALGYVRGENNIREAIYCFVSFLENDNAYNRVWDCLGEGSKLGVAEPRKEVRRIFDRWLSREHSIDKKVRMIRSAVSFLLWVSPAARKRTSRFFEEMDFEKIRLDDDDMYFNLRREYDYRGISKEERYALAERIDKEKGHIILHI